MSKKKCSPCTDNLIKKLNKIVCSKVGKNEKAECKSIIRDALSADSVNGEELLLKLESRFGKKVLKDI